MFCIDEGSNGLSPSLCLWVNGVGVDVAPYLRCLEHTAELCGHEYDSIRHIAQKQFNEVRKWGKLKHVFMLAYVKHLSKQLS